MPDQDIFSKGFAKGWKSAARKICKGASPEIAADVTLSVFDIFKKKLPDYVLRHRAELQFDAIATEIGENLIAFLERETGTIPENEKEAAAYAVAESFDKSAISPKILLAQDLDPIQLENFLRQLLM